MSLWYIILFILNYRKGFIMKRPTLHKLILSILLFAISFLALFTSHKSSAFADWYSSTIYPLFVSSIGRFFGIFQFSVSEIGLYIFVILLFLSLIRMLISSIYKMYAQKKNPAWLGYGSSLLLLCGCLFTIYTFFCGINYGHTSFAEKYHLESGQYTQAETDLFMQRTDWSVKYTFWFFRPGFWRSCWYG